MRLANTDFELGLLAPVLGYEVDDNWDHRAHRVELDAGRWSSARRLRGFAAGGPVTAVGRVMADGTFQARYIIGASRAAVVETLEPIAEGRTTILAFWLAVFSLVGLIATTAVYVRSRWRAESG